MISARLAFSLFLVLNLNLVVHVYGAGSDSVPTEEGLARCTLDGALPSGEVDTVGKKVAIITDLPIVVVQVGR